MTKSDLIKVISQKTGKSNAASAKVVDAIFGAIQEALKKGEKVTLVGFGTFEVAKRAAREGINPHTQKKIKIKATKAPRFRAGGGLKNAILGDTESTGPRKLKG